MKQGAYIEWLVGVIRVGPGSKGYPDPFNFVCTIMKEGDTAYLLAAHGDFSRDTYRAIEELMKELDIKEARWDKKNISHRKIKKKAK